MSYDNYAKLFSQNTFTQINYRYPGYTGHSDTLQYTLNSAGKLETEGYNNADSNFVYITTTVINSGQ